MMSSSDDNAKLADENIKDAEVEEDEDGENGEGGQDLECFTNNGSSSGETPSAHQIN